MSNMYSTDVWRPGSELITPNKEAPSWEWEVTIPSSPVETARLRAGK